MPDYQIQITKTAQKQLDKLPETIANTLLKLSRVYQITQGRMVVKN
jgi:mRNA-degrading endonuclease RelE of RelBE toxin-antitoxin system